MGSLKLSRRVDSAAPASGPSGLRPVAERDDTGKDRKRVRVWARGSEVFLDEGRLFDGSRDELLQTFDLFLRSPQVSLVVTPNVDHVLRLEIDPQLRGIYASADLRIVDGAPLAALASVIAHRRVGRITGADLLGVCTAESGERGWRIAILGTLAVVDRAVAKLAEDHPAADLHAVDVPFVRDVTSETLRDCAAELRELAPDIVFVCLSSPKQEQFVDAWRPYLPHAVYIGAGASAEFAAGDLTRAPELLRRIGAEWVWRLVHEPRRLGGRYLVRGPRFLMVVARSLWRRRPSSEST